MRILFLIGLCTATFALQIHRRRKFIFNNTNVLRTTDTQELKKEQWFAQRLDHFSLKDTRTWKQRYYVNEDYFDKSHPGPVFLMIGAEDPTDAGSLIADGAWIEYAKQFKALCFTLEHRYYGESHPTEDASINNLKYLSSQQALADLANFIAGMNEQYKFDDNVKWVAFGASYAGSLAAWLRLKYPRSVHAAVSSSGPLLYKLNFEEYYEAVINIISKTSEGSKCVEALKAAHRQIAELFENNPSELDSKFRLCKSLTKATKNDVRILYILLANLFAAVVLNDEYGPNSVCGILTKRTDVGPYERLGIFYSTKLNVAKETCLDYDYALFISAIRAASWSAFDVENGGRQWYYQMCTEFANFETSSGETEAFGNDFTVDFFIQECQDIFGPQFNRDYIQKGIDNTNTVYGALDISVDRVVFVHGSNDPWHTLGITKTRQEGAPAVYIDGTGHCADLFSSQPGDSKALKEARAKIVQYLSGWLQI